MAASGSRQIVLTEASPRPVGQPRKHACAAAAHGARLHCVRAAGYPTGAELDRMKLVDQLPPGRPYPRQTAWTRGGYTRFVEWTEGRGGALYTAQEEAIMELAAG